MKRKRHSTASEPAQQEISAPEKPPAETSSSAEVCHEHGGKEKMTNPGEANSIEQVRDLLMGTQLKDMEQRLVRQEERFLREISDLRESMKTRSDSLENFMRSEVSSLLHRLQEEQNERAAATKSEQRDRAGALENEKRERGELLEKERRERNETFAQIAKNLVAVEESFDRKLAALSGTLDTVERDLRQLLLTENGRLADKIDEKYKDSINALSVISSQIRSDMTTRSVLSGLLSEVAIKLAQWNGNDILVKLEEEQPLQIGQNEGSGKSGPAN